MFVNFAYMQIICGRAKARAHGDVKVTFISVLSSIKNCLKDYFCLSHLDTPLSLSFACAPALSLSLSLSLSLYLSLSLNFQLSLFDFLVPPQENRTNNLNDQQQMICYFTFTTNYDHHSV